MNDDLKKYVDVLAQGGVIACATETFFGLLADATNPDVVHRVARIKGRPENAPIAVLLPDTDAVTVLAKPLGDDARALAEAHWPGPLTLVSWAHPGVASELVRDGKIGMRVPGPSPALDIVRVFGKPLTATSANLSGELAVAHDHALAPVLTERLDAVVPGIAPGGSPSTVVDITGEVPVVLRAGAVSLAV